MNINGSVLEHKSPFIIIHLVNFIKHQNLLSNQFNKYRIYYALLEIVSSFT